MSSTVTAVSAVVCICLAAFLFFRNTYTSFLNIYIRKFWYQAEKCYVNFELMFLEERFTLGRCQLIVLCSTVFVSFLAAYFSSRAPSAIIPFVAGGIGALVGWVLPGYVSVYLHKRYVGKFDSQFLDGLGMLGSGLRSGLSLQQAIGMIADEMPAPISREFKLVLSEYNYGKTLDESFERMAKRIPSIDLGITIESILILRSTGANLIETFDIIVDTVRERKKIEEKIKSMTALGVIQGFILGAMPFVLMYVLHLFNPSYMEPFFSTTIGWVMMGIVILLVTVGALVIKQIITIDV